MRALAAVNLAPHLALRVIYQYLALTTLDKHHKSGDQPSRNKNPQGNKEMHCTGSHQLKRSTNGARQPGRNAGKNDERYTIANTRAR